MGRIKKLKNNELVGGTDKTTIYPITSTKAIFEEVSDNEFKSQKYLNNHITGDRIENNTIPGDKLEDKAVTEEKVSDALMDKINSAAHGVTEEFETEVREALEKVVNTVSINNDTPLQPDVNKNINITVPEDLKDLNEDSNHRIVTDAEKSTWNGKQDALTFDNVPTANSNNPVKSGGIYQAIQSIDVTDQISGKADKSEMSVVAGTGADADKTTITLKNGTSATVLTQHQDVSEFLKEGEVFGTGDDSTASFNPYSDTVWNKQQTLSEVQKQQIRDNIGVSIADNEDIQSVNGTLKFADRAYTATTSSVQGNMGYKILRKGSTFASQVTAANTIYEIRYDYDLNGQTITLPAGCVLFFNGGKISNGSLAFQNTTIISIADGIFQNVIVTGNVVNKTIYDSWFVYTDETIGLKYVFELDGYKTLELKQNHLYQIDTTQYFLDTNISHLIEFDGKKNVTINGNSCTIKDTSNTYYLDNHKFFSFLDCEDCENITIQELTITSESVSIEASDLETYGLRFVIATDCEEININVNASNIYTILGFYGRDTLMKARGAKLYATGSNIGYYLVTSVVSDVCCNLNVEGYYHRLAYFGGANGVKMDCLMINPSTRNASIICHEGWKSDNGTYVFYETKNTTINIYCQTTGKLPAFVEFTQYGTSLESGAVSGLRTRPYDFCNNKINIVISGVFSDQNYELLRITQNERLNTSVVDSFEVDAKIIYLNDIPFNANTNAYVLNGISPVNSSLLQQNYRLNLEIVSPIKDSKKIIRVVNMGKDSFINLRSQCKTYMTTLTSLDASVYGVGLVTLFDTSVELAPGARHANFVCHNSFVARDHAIQQTESISEVVPVYHDATSLLDGIKAGFHFMKINITGHVAIDTNSGYDRMANNEIFRVLLVNSTETPYSFVFIRPITKYLISKYVPAGKCKLLEFGKINGKIFVKEIMIEGSINYGDSSERPTLNGAYRGLQFYDLTLSKPIWWTGTSWVDATGTAV